MEALKATMGRTWLLWWLPIAAPAQSDYEELMFSRREAMEMLSSFRDKEKSDDTPWLLAGCGLILVLLVWAGLSPHLV